MRLTPCIQKGFERKYLDAGQGMMRPILLEASERRWVGAQHKEREGGAGSYKSYSALSQFGRVFTLRSSSKRKCRCKNLSDHLVLLSPVKPLM